jgi:hypothetical protein
METTEGEDVEMGELERSLAAAQEMICGVMISYDSAKQCHHPWLYHVNDHNASVTPHVNCDREQAYI